MLDENIKQVEIIPAPYVVIQTLGERLDYRFTVLQIESCYKNF